MKGYGEMISRKLGKISLIVLIVLSISTMMLIGCASNPTEKPEETTAAANQTTNAPAAEEKITLKFLNKYPEEQYLKYFEQAVADYETLNPNVDIQMESVSDEAIKDKLSVMASGGELPDIFFSWSGEFVKKFARAGLIKDLTPYVEADKAWSDAFYPAFLNNSTFDGKTYGIPYRSSALFVLYNKSIFTEKNIAVPKTYTEFLDVCEKLKQNGITPMAFGNSSPWYAAWWIGTLNAVLVDPEVTFKDYNPNSSEFTNPDYVKAVQYFIDMNEKGNFGPNISSKDYYQVREEFSAGLTGMILDATSQFSIYTDAMGDDWGFFKFPEIEGAAGDPGYVTGGAEVYCISNTSANPDAAADFIKFMTTKEQAIKQTTESGLPNCIQGGITTDNASPIMVEAYEIVKEYTNIADWLDTAVESRIADQYMTSLQEALNGNKTAEQVMADVIKVAAEVKADFGS